MKGFVIAAAAWSAAALVACETPPTQQQGGAIIGGVLGGVVGSQVGHGAGRTAATIVGTLVGAGIGGAVGRAMDDADRMKTAHALETARTGAPTRWVNPDTGHQYAVVPTRTFEGATGPCREYAVDATIGGRSETIHGTACRQDDGSWRAAPDRSGERR